MTTAGCPRCSARSTAWIAAAFTGDIAAAGTCEGALICAMLNRAAARRVRGLGQQLQGVGGVEVLERGQRGGEVLPQRVPQPLAGPGPFPDQRLVHPGDHLDRLGLGAITRDRTQLMGVGAHHVGQHVRVGRVALGPRHPQALPIPGRLQRIDREHRVPGGDQRLHPRTPIGLNPDRDLPGGVLGIFAELRADHRVHPRDPRHTLRQASLGQLRPAASINSTS